jgi:uncharacterized membrane protein YsdA (DUF1294 family)
MRVRTTSHVSRSRRSVGIVLRSVLLLVLLLAVPAVAASRLMSVLDWRVLFGVPIVLSILAFLAYRSDKRRAEAGAWRIPEFTLHMMALIGGWPGAFLGQRQFRHKTSKLSFQVIFWIIVLAYQLVAVDSLMGWRLSQDAWRFVKSQTA